MCKIHGYKTLVIIVELKWNLVAVLISSAEIPLTWLWLQKESRLDWLPLLKVKRCLDIKLKCLLRTVKLESKICLSDTSPQGTQLCSKNLGLCNKMSTHCNNNLTLPMYPSACLAISFGFPFVCIKVSIWIEFELCFSATYATLIEFQNVFVS